MTKMTEVIILVKRLVGCTLSKQPSAVALHWNIDCQQWHMDCHFNKDDPLLIVLLLLVAATSTEVTNNNSFFM